MKGDIHRHTFCKIRVKQKLHLLSRFYLRYQLCTPAVIHSLDGNDVMVGQLKDNNLSDTELH